jgi:hypothetical protein
MCKWGNSCKVILPDHIAPWSKRRVVSIDQCIVEPIKALWKANIQTTASCCGHFQLNPRVILHRSCSDVEIQKACDILEKVDDREWEVFQWRLIHIKRKSNE